MLLAVPKILRWIPLEVHGREYIGRMFRADDRELVGLTDHAFSRERLHVPGSGRHGGRRRLKNTRSAAAVTSCKLKLYLFTGQGPELPEVKAL